MSKKRLVIGTQLFFSILTGQKILIVILMLQCLYNYERKISQIILWKKTKITKVWCQKLTP